MAIPNFFREHQGPWSNGIETGRVAEAMKQVAKSDEISGTDVLIIEGLRTGSMIQHATSPDEGGRFVESDYVVSQLGLYAYDEQYPYLVGLRHEDRDAQHIFMLAVAEALDRADAELTEIHSF